MLILFGMSKQEITIEGDRRTVISEWKTFLIRYRTSDFNEFMLQDSKNATVTMQ